MGTRVTPDRSGRLRALFTFPNPVNEVSARLVAGGVVLMVVVTLALGLKWATAVIFYGFAARVLTGPTLSPLGQLATRVITPRLGLPARPVAGPPKRFAQAVGVAFSGTALLLTALGYWTAAEVALVLLGFAALLESAFGICLGCTTFALLIERASFPKRSARAATTSGPRREAYPRSRGASAVDQLSYISTPRMFLPSRMS
jgi:hypothetical protein